MDPPSPSYNMTATTPPSHHMEQVGMRMSEVLGLGGGVLFLLALIGCFIGDRLVKRRRRAREAVERVKEEMQRQANEWVRPVSLAITSATYFYSGGVGAHLIVRGAEIPSESAMQYLFALSL